MQLPAFFLLLYLEKYFLVRRSKTSKLYDCRFIFLCLFFQHIHSLARFYEEKRNSIVSIIFFFCKRFFIDERSSKTPTNRLSLLEAKQHAHHQAATAATAASTATAYPAAPQPHELRPVDPRLHHGPRHLPPGGGNHRCQGKQKG